MTSIHSGSSAMVPDLFDLRGKTAVVTGASSGIGEAIARELAAHGAKVVVSSIDLDLCNRVVHDLVAQGAEAVAIRCDVGKPEDLENVIESASASFGGIDILVCNAGVGPHFGPMAAATDAEYELTMAINLRSILRLTSLVIPGMAARGRGSVIIISSIAGLRGNKMLGLYGVSKAASAQLARNLAVEWGPQNVRVNTISPGVIETPFATAITADPLRSATRKGVTPLRRFGTPRDIAGVAVFLASDAANFVTGHNLVVDGGTIVSDGS
ncbi:SDR family oxidoreductase [Paraburkholderia strydomiana]|uniref:SDR family NAD(P)-dependent oxidoreductase n=1 Tax=Paraburkholderia strydomiana TaxID=1245417 RepID=UPI0038BBA24A